MVTTTISVFAALFSVLNPLGAVPVFLAMTPTDTKEERNTTARSTAIYVVLILIAFFLAGSAILGFFGISLDAMRIAGGLIILSSGYALLNGKFADSRAVNKQVKKEAIEKEDISFTPMAMPLLAGPGSISLLISLYAENPDWYFRGSVLGVIVAIGLTVYIILRLAPALLNLLGVAGLKAVSRIMGFLTMAIGIQYIMAGLTKMLGIG